MHSFDLPAYFTRTGYRGPSHASLEVLEELCLCHVGAIPFENLDPLAGVPVSLDLEALQAKLVNGRRGGYCFEHNSLFRAVLEALGFPVTLLEARVRNQAAPDLATPRTHGVLKVEAGGGTWLVDVGFGGDGLLGPVAMDGTETRRHGERWRLAPQGPCGLLQAELGDGWRGFYEVQPGEVFPVDWVVANHYTSTHPQSRFRRVLTVQTSAPGRRRILRGRTMTEFKGGELEVRELEPGEVLSTIREVFGLDITRDLFDAFPKDWFKAT